MGERLRGRKLVAAALAWTAVAAGVGVLAAFSLGRSPEDTGALLALALMAGAMLVLAVWEAKNRSGAHRPPLVTVIWQGIVEQPWRGVAFVGAFSLLASVMRRLPHMPPSADFTAVTVTWLVAFLFYVVAVAPPRPRPRHDWSIWWEVNRANVLMLTAIVGVALWLRAWGLDRAPAALAGDEATFAREALRVLRGELRNPFMTGWLSQPTMTFFYTALSVRVFGFSVMSVRLPWAIVGTLSVLVTFWLVSRLKGGYVGMVTAALLATYHLHVHYSRLNLNNIADPFFMGLTLLWLMRALDRRSPLDWVLAGAAAGGALYGYTGGRLVPVVALVVLLYYWAGRGRRFWAEQRVGLLSAVGAFLIVAAPMLQFAYRFPDEFNGRINQVGIVQNGWLAQEMEARGQGALPILWDQFQRTVLGFLLYPDRAPFYSLPHPLLDPFFGTLFFAGLLYAMVRLVISPTDRRLFPFVAWWWGGVIFGGVLTQGPPSSQRLVTLSVPVTFFIALALWRMTFLLRRLWGGLPALPVLVAGVLLFALINVRLYFFEYIPSATYGGPVA
ncbi:MAG: glycosyltransferase family 39 protein [Ardenticatenia bacterium]|nr:glycosyltransferase family 39 protein [Ardenticatenia bacterium]